MLIPVFDGIRAGVSSSKVITQDSMDLIEAYVQDNVDKQESLVDRLSQIENNPTSNKVHRYLASKLKASLVRNNYDIPIYYADFEQIKPNWYAFYSPNAHYIGVRGDITLTDQILLHEAIHAITSREMVNDQQFARQMNEL